MVSSIPFCIILAVLCSDAHFVERISNSTDALNFIVMGDWGGLPVVPYYSPFEKATASAMAQVARYNDSRYIFALGDNFYYDGVTNVSDPRFQTTFENVFSQQSLMDIDWFLVAGNHDHNGNVSAQIAYSHHSRRWQFPDMWYQVHLQRPSFNMTIIMIDTVVLCGNTGEHGELEQPQGPENLLMAETQLMYIESALMNASKWSQYILVMGHFPVYSIAEHGPTECLIDVLDPLLVKYKVSAYFNGHDHNLQHIRHPTSGMNYFVTGAVDVVDPSMKHVDSIPNGSLLFHWADIFGLGGFATVDVDKNGMEVRFHKASVEPSDILYKYHIPPRM
ncbi:tartrate-resistant acid phosphatase type 5-like [Styela clava]